MSESPKRIWVIRNRYVVDPEKTCERIVPYIRADLVNGLVEALEELCKYANDSDDCQYGTLSTRLMRDIAKDALKALEEE